MRLVVCFVALLLFGACDAFYVRISKAREIELVDLQRYYTQPDYKNVVDTESEQWPTLHTPHYGANYEISYGPLVDAQQVDGRWTVDNWIRAPASFPGRGDMLLTVDISDLATFVKLNPSLAFADIEATTLRYAVEMVSLDQTFPDMQIETGGMRVTFMCARADEPTFRVCSGANYKFIAVLKS